ncbi:hypothetical protein ACFVRD_21335 [Streptomyces sp. NPDC057908]
MRTADGPADPDPQKAGQVSGHPAPGRPDTGMQTAPHPGRAPSAQ